MVGIRSNVFSAVAALQLVAACGDDSSLTGGASEGGAGGQVNEGAAGGGGTGGAEGGAPPLLEWGACTHPYYLETCAMMEAPLDHDGVDEGAVQIHLSRSIGTAAGPHHSLWLLNGGPGGSGAGYGSYVAQMRPLLGDDWDFYTIDHRGTGASTLLCPLQEADGQLGNAELQPCINGLNDNLELAHHFTSEAAARDVLLGIDAVAKEGDDAFLYGYSYGAYWAIRTAQIAPEKLAGALIGGIPTPGRLWFAEWDVNADGVGQRLADYCTAEARCSTEMAGDPWARIGEAFDLLGQGHCTEAGLTPDTLRIILNQALDDHDLRALVFPTIRRFTRCDASDVAALVALRGAMSDELGFDLGDDAYAAYSTILHYNVTLSELLMDPEAPYTYQEVDAFYQASYFGSGFAPYYVNVASVWPTYERDPAVEEPIDASVPLLMMNGELDDRTVEVHARQFGEAQHGASQAYFEVPFGAHGASTQCELDMWTAFLHEPSAPVDGFCLSDVETFTTDVEVSFATAWMDTPDLWGGAPTGASAEARASLRAAARAKQLLPRSKGPL